MEQVVLEIGQAHEEPKLVADPSASIDAVGLATITYHSSPGFDPILATPACSKVRYSGSLVWPASGVHSVQQHKPQIHQHCPEFA